MPSFMGLFSTISRFLPGPSAKLEELILRLNPDKIYLENVRNILGVSTTKAKTICETAVRQGVFSRRVEVLCPDGSVAASADSEQSLPNFVRCWNEEAGNIQEVELETDGLRRNVYYRLNEQPVSNPHR